MRLVLMWQVVDVMVVVGGIVTIVADPPAYNKTRRTQLLQEKGYRIIQYN